jgi:multicomponent Na+:H+ antiporter subunit F
VTPPGVLVGISLVLLGVAAVLCLVRGIRGPSALDRVVALDVFLVVIAAGVVVRGTQDSESLSLVVLLVVALLGFAGTVTAARLVERRRR